MDNSVCSFLISSGTSAAFGQEMVYRCDRRPHILGVYAEEPDVDHDAGIWQPCTDIRRCTRWQHLLCANDSREEIEGFQCNGCHDTPSPEPEIPADNEVVESAAQGTVDEGAMIMLAHEIDALNTVTAEPQKKMKGRKHEITTKAGEGASGHTPFPPDRANTHVRTHRSHAITSNPGIEAVPGTSQASLEIKFSKLLEAYKTMPAGNASGLFPGAAYGDFSEPGTAAAMARLVEVTPAGQRSGKFRLFRSRTEEPAPPATGTPSSTRDSSIETEERPTPRASPTRKASFERQDHEPEQSNGLSAVTEKTNGVGDVEDPYSFAAYSRLRQQWSSDGLDSNAKPKNDRTTAKAKQSPKGRPRGEVSPESPADKERVQTKHSARNEQQRTSISPEGKGGAASPSLLDDQALVASVINFCKDTLWLKYCRLSSNTLDGTLLRRVTETNVNDKGITSPVHSAPEKWLAEMSRQIILLLQASKSVNADLMEKSIRRPGFRGHDPYRILKDELVVVVNRGAYRGKRRELGLLLEIAGIEDQGTYWQP